MVINELVCEGCGDCGVQSNCVAIVPVETEFGRKRAIDQSSCNKDFSCLKGFCPSFVTVHGAKRHAALDRGRLRAAGDHAAGDAWTAIAMLITGVGGTGVVTIGAILAMAAHLEGKGVGVIDMAGLAQKGGPVTSHVRIAPTPGSVKAIRVAAGGADTILACDMVVAGTAQVACRDPPQPHPRLRQHPRDLSRRIHPRPGHDAADAAADRGDHRPGRARSGRRTIEATRDRHRAPWRRDRHQHVHARPRLAVGRRSRSSSAAIERAIELNGVDVAMNKAAFAWGRRAAVEPDTVARDRGAPHRADACRRSRRSTRWSSGGPASSPPTRTRAMRAATAPRSSASARPSTRWRPGRDNLAQAVAVNLFRLMAIKDEYEVARLYTDGSFAKQLRREFASWGKTRVPPRAAAPRARGPGDRPSGQVEIRAVDDARLHGCSPRRAGSAAPSFDPFRYSADRRLERRLLADYEETLSLIAANLRADNYLAAVALAEYPEKIRGYGPIKAESAAKAMALATEREVAFARRRAAAGGGGGVGTNGRRC